jgi:hypothetical protein
LWITKPPFFNLLPLAITTINIKKKNHFIVHCQF